MDRLKTWIMAMAIGAGIALAVTAAGCAGDECADGTCHVEPDVDTGSAAERESGPTDSFEVVLESGERIVVTDANLEPGDPRACSYAGQQGIKCKGDATGGGVCCGVAGMWDWPYCTTNKHPIQRPGPPPYYPYMPACKPSPDNGHYRPYATTGNRDHYDWDGNGQDGYQGPPDAGP